MVEETHEALLDLAQAAADSAKSRGPGESSEGSRLQKTRTNNEASY